MKAIRTAELDIEDIATIHNRIRTQKLSPVEVLAGCLKRIEQVNPQLNAFITVLADQALAQATAAEAEIKAGKWRGPCMAFRSRSKTFTIPPGSKRPRPLNDSKTACHTKMPLVSQSLKKLAQS